MCPKNPSIEGRDALPGAVVDLLSTSARTSGLDALLGHLLGACRAIGTHIRDGGFSSEKVGTANTFGDEQLEVDVKSDEVVFAALNAAGTVHVAASEENPVETSCSCDLESGGFSVAFDPLDGSSIVDCNFAVGSIFGIWPDKGLLNRTGKEQCAALVAQYGPRVTIALGLSAESCADGQPLSVELTMRPDAWVVSIPRFQIAPVAKTFAPGNLRATSDNQPYMDLIQFYIKNKYTLRYSGGLVPDVYHILVKGQGILTNASSPKAKAKLRLLFEAAPIALIIHAAGGDSCACASEAAEEMEPTSLLNVVATDIDRRVGVAYGSKDEVDRFRTALFS